MSGPRIKVSQCYEAGFEWKCTAATHHQCDGPIREWVRGRTIAAAADAGRAHLAEHHAAQMPAVAHGDPEPAYAVHRCSGECPPSPSSQCATCRQFFTTGAWGGPPMTDEQKTRMGWTR